MKPLYIKFEECYFFLQNLLQHNHFSFEISSGKHKLLIFLNEEKIADFLFPLPLPILSDNLQEYISIHFDEIPNYVIYIIQAGSCALGYFEKEKLIEHKVFKTYMVRKKQGKNQIKHLKSKGKSKAGSRIRLSNTIHFFEQINKRLQEYFESYYIDKVVYTCPKNMISLFYESKVSPPFNKTDKRLIKIPIDTQQPSFEELLNINKKICSGKLTFYNERYKDELNKFCKRSST